MAPRTWHGAEHAPFFMEWMPRFIQRQAQQKLYKFWGPMFEAWFEGFPEQKGLGLPLPQPGGNAPALSDQELDTLGKAVSKRKQMLENYFRNNRAKLDPGAAKKNKSLYALARSLFKAKPARKRLHKAVELFQLRNNRLIQEECSRKGHDAINEEKMSAAVADWVNESDKAQVARIKAAQAARLRLRNRVVHALFAEASDEELAIIADLMEREKAGEIVEGEEDDEGLPARTPAEYQTSIDESWDVMKKVHAAMEKMTGWYGFSIWGGPNPRIGGELSMKSVSFGLSPTGLDFEATHADFEKAVELPFQLFLRRCFPPEIRSRRSLDAPVTDAAPTEDETKVVAGFRLPNDSDPPAKKRPKRMTKPKKSEASEPDAASSTTTTATSPASTALAPRAAPTPPPAPAPVHPVSTPTMNSTGDDSHLTSNLDFDNVQPAANASFDALSSSDPFNGLDTFFEEDGFGLDGMEIENEGDEVGMPPLPSASTRWDTGPIEGYNITPPPPAVAQTTTVNGFNFAIAPNDPGSRMNSLFADYRRLTQDSPTRGNNLMNPSSLSLSAPRTMGHDPAADADSSPVPARFRRWDSSPIRPTLSLGAGGPSSGPLPAFGGSVRRLVLPIVLPTAVAKPAPPASTPTMPPQLPSAPMAPTPPQPAGTLSLPSGVPVPARRPILPQSRPEANVPKPAVVKPVAKPKPAGGTKQPKQPRGKAGAARAKSAAQVAEKKKKAAGRGRAAAEEEASVDEAVEEVPDTGVLVDTSNTLIYSMTNNSIKFDKELKARQAAAAAAKAPKTPVVPNLLYNPDGPSDLVILTRPRREPKLRINPDNTAVSLPVKRTLAERRQISNARTENALLARTGRLPVEGSSGHATKATARRGSGRGRGKSND
ncbi:hypothetical protein C8R43DRAFT_1132227 [Mycena crocata]|nr:hypothetical protein C8R43DRAFT_1132227 [Mycena crocata]